MSKPTLLILAAGMGSRYGSLKQIEPIGPNGEAIIDYSVYDAIKAGFGKVVFVIKKQIEQEFRDSLLKRFEDKVDVDYVFQELDMLPEGYSVPENRIKPWGTAHAILVSEKAISTPFAAINADDFYGFEAFQEMYSFLAGKTNENDYCMIGYKLKNTLSEHGSVSRGICNIDSNQFLQSVTERTKIQEENGKVVFYEEDKSCEIDPDSLVSMNIWGFTPSVFKQIRKRFSAFLDESMNQPKAEYYIPTLVDQLISEEEASVKVITCNASWFGITYKEDRAAAVEGLRTKIENGEYPENLWG